MMRAMSRSAEARSLELVGEADGFAWLPGRRGGDRKVASRLPRVAVGLRPAQCRALSDRTVVMPSMSWSPPPVSGAGRRGWDAPASRSSDPASRPMSTSGCLHGYRGRRQVWRRKRVRAEVATLPGRPGAAETDGWTGSCPAGRNALQFIPFRFVVGRLKQLERSSVSAGVGVPPQDGCFVELLGGTPVREGSAGELSQQGKDSGFT